MGVSDLWQWLKDHDAPNWFVIAFSLIVWPILITIFLYLWNKRKIQEFPHFVISPIPGQQTIINGQPYDAVGFTFTNRTGSVVYVNRVRLRAHKKNFPIPPAAVKSPSGWHELKFQQRNSAALIDDERIFNTNERVLTKSPSHILWITSSTRIDLDFFVACFGCQNIGLWNISLSRQDRFMKCSGPAARLRVA